MNRSLHTMAVVIGGLLLANSVWAQAHAPVLDHIPSDARGFVVLRELASTADKVDALATRLQLPVPRLAAMLGAFEQGLDKERNVALAWLDQRDGDDPQTAYTHFVLYLPVKDYSAFIGQFDVEDASGNITEVTLNEQTLVVAKKDDFAIAAQAHDLDSLKQVLDAKASIVGISKPFHEWLNQNDLTIAISPSGTALMFAKLKEGLEFVKQGAVAAAGDNAGMIESALDMYRTMFDYGEKEFTQVAIGLRIEPDESVEIHKRVLLSPDGSMTKAAADFKRPERPIAGLPAGPFVLAFDGALPNKWPKEMMAMSFNMLKGMQGPDAKDLTEEQIDKLSEAASQSMQGVRSMSFVLGAGEAGESIYSHTVGILRVDDSKAFMEGYEKAISEMSKLMKGTQLFGAYEVKRLQVEDRSVIHFAMDMSKFQFGGAEDMPDMKEYFEKMLGPGGKVSAYLTAADDQAVVMAYTSTDNLKRALESYGAAAAGLASDTEVKKTASMLPASAQWVGYISPSGTMQFVAQMAGIFAPDDELEFPNFPASPPVGLAAEMTPAHLDAQLVVPVETIDAVKDFVMQMRKGDD